MNVCVDPLYRGPAEMISIHIEDRHDVEAELIKQASHPGVPLVWADGLENAGFKRG